MSDAPDRRILPYVSTVILLGGLSAAWLLLKTPVPYGEFLSPVIFVFTLCSIVGEAVPLKVFRGNMEGELSTSTTFAVAMMLWAGPAVAFVALSGANVIADLVRGKPLHRIAFNIGQYAISLTVSGLAMSLTTDLPHQHAGLFAPSDLPGVILAGIVFWFVNVALVATVIAMVQGLGIMRYLVHEWLFQASTAGMLLCGLGPVLVVVADFSLPAVDPAVPAAVRDPSRQPPRDRQGAPGAPRRADRPAEPRCCSATASTRRSRPASAPATSPP